MITGTKADFPLLRSRKDNGKSLVYLDNAATTQKPEEVIEAVSDYYRRNAANPHRGAYTLSSDATELYEAARARVANFIGAQSSEQIVFTKNATESLNLVAFGFGMQRVQKGDEILISVAEHHSNLLPWQAVARAKGAVLRYLYLDKAGRVTLQEVEQKLTDKTKIVAVTQLSNVLGVENPIAEIAALVHAKNAVLVVDGAQSVPHIPVDVQALDVDFLAFSGHKMLGPDGAGVLYGKPALLQETQPYMLGGGIVEEVTEQTVRFLDPPLRFEAGTPNVEGAVGLHAAMDYLQTVGFEKIVNTELELTSYMLQQMQSVKGIKIYGEGPQGQRHGIVAFNVGAVHPHDVATILDSQGVAVRAGHHCAQPLMQYLGIRFCCRASLYFTNTKEDIDRFVQALHQVERWL